MNALLLIKLQAHCRVSVVDDDDDSDTITTRSSHAALFILFRCDKQVFPFDFLSLKNLVFFLLKNDMKISSDVRSRVMAYYEYLVSILSLSFNTSCVFQTGHGFLVVKSLLLETIRLNRRESLQSEL